MLKRHLAVVLLASLSLLPLSSRTIFAQAAPQSEAVQGSSLVEIERSIVRAIGAQDRTVEITVSRTVLTVVRVNSNMNESTHAGRDNEATAIAGIVSKAIAGKPEFNKLITLRVEYIARSPQGETKVVDSVEFREDPDGVFRFHST